MRNRENQLPLEEMVAVVTGAGSGIGLATAKMLCSRGARVAGLDLSPGTDERIGWYLTDVTSQGSVSTAVEAVKKDLGGIDAVVNCAGIGSVGAITDNDDQEWHRVFDVNVVGIARVMRAVLPHLVESQFPSVVNIASIAANVGLIERACYSASKGAVLSLTRAMAADALRDGIRVNCVCPGTIDTPWVERLLAQVEDPISARSLLAARQPIGRLGTPEEVAAVINFLVEPSASFITGAAFAVDGGMEGLRIIGGKSQ